MRKLFVLLLPGGEAVSVNQAVKSSKTAWLRQLKEVTFTVEDEAASPLADPKLGGRSSPFSRRGVP